MWYGCDVYKCAYEQRGMGVQVRVVCVYVYECAHGQWVLGQELQELPETAGLCLGVA